MEKITYGAPRLVDWVAQVKAGAATLRVHFTGGALTSYGVTPAEYTTSNPFIQKVIENSTYFKEGRIILLRKATIPDSPKPKSKKPKAQPAPTPVVEKPEAETQTIETPAPVAPSAPTVETEQQQNVAETSDKTESENNETSELTKVEVTCLQDAQAYLQENFNISSYKVRSYEAAQRAGAEHGIEFTGAKFDTLNSGDKSESEGADEGE
ncbi:MAG: hypothetical protein K2N13_01035 [Paraprevotella sp.]|nr:hypothetical protein [Paraprevotella sp.]